MTVYEMTMIVLIGGGIFSFINGFQNKIWFVMTFLNLCILFGTNIPSNGEIEISNDTLVTAIILLIINAIAFVKVIALIWRLIKRR